MSNVVAISGASGFIGSYLVNFFEEHQFTVINIHREDFIEPDILQQKLSESQFVINLAGRSVFTRWTAETKKEILDSRINTTRKIVQTLNGIDKPIHLLNASAVGVYKPNMNHNDESEQFDIGFLSDVVQAWEHEANKLNNHSVSLLRFGVILGKSGGAFKTIRLFNRFRIGNYFGKGNQPFPFIHVHDLARAMFRVMNQSIYGPVNFAAPQSISYYDFMTQISRHYAFFLLFPVPIAVIKFVLGEASQFIIENPQVYPKKLLISGFNFTYPNITDCLNELI